MSQGEKRASVTNPKWEKFLGYLHPPVTSTFYTQPPSWNLCGIKDNFWLLVLTERHTQNLEPDQPGSSLCSASPWPRFHVSLRTSTGNREQSTVCLVTLLWDLGSLACDTNYHSTQVVSVRWMWGVTQGVWRDAGVMMSSRIPYKTANV